jgi:enamine deaminase RidA (YjgF/YER057c/UK114 family)
MPRDMAGQAHAALENLRRGLEAVAANFGDVVTADRFVTDLTDQDALNRVWAEYFRDDNCASGSARDRSALPHRDQRHRRDRLSPMSGLTTPASRYRDRNFYVRFTPAA